MSLLTLGIAVSAYAGTRALDTVRDRQRKVRLRALSPVGADRAPRPPGTDDLAEHTHYLRISGLALALALTRPLTPAFAPVSIALTIYSTLPLMRRAEDSVSQGEIRNDLLSSVVCLATLGLGQTLAAALQVAAFHLGYQAVGRSRNLADRAISHGVAVPERIRVRRGLREIAIAPSETERDDLVIVRTGDIVPVDGRVIEGGIAVDQHQLTGEWRAKPRSYNDEVFAGTLVVEGRALLQITHSGNETAIAQLNATLRDTADYTSRLQLLGERWSDRIAPPLLLGSAAALPFIGVSSATAILFSAPANAIRATAALSTSSHLTAVTQSGVSIKDGRALEALAGVDTFLFDKTGTLTSDDLAVSEIRPLGTWTREQLLVRAAAAEAGISHPLAKALIATASAETDAPLEDLRTEQSRFRLGYGVTSLVSGVRVRVGSPRLMAEAGVAIEPAVREVLDAAEANGTSVVLIADDDQIQGIIEIRPQLRPEIGTVVAALRRRGVRRIQVVSGDSEGPTRRIAESLQLDGSFHDVLPEDKAALVRRLQAAGHRVCFVGDGINDAPAMKQAHCSISLHGASAAASDTAQILLLEASLAKLPGLLATAQSQQSHLKEVLVYWAGYAVVNTYLNLVLRIGVLPSTLVYATAFGVSYMHSGHPRVARENRTAQREAARLAAPQARASGPSTEQPA